MKSGFVRLVNRFAWLESELYRSVSSAMTFRIIGAVAAFCLNVILAWRLGAEGSGQFYLALTMMLLLTVVGRLGLDGTVLRFVARAAAVNDWFAARRVCRDAVATVSVASILVAVLGWIMAESIADTLFAKPEMRHVIEWMMLVTVPFSVLMVVAHALQGARKISLSITLTSALLPVIAATGVLVTSTSLGVVGAVWSYAAGAIVCASIGALYWTARIPKFSSGNELITRQEIVNSAIPLFVVSLLQPLTSWIPVLALGVWGRNDDVGMFEAANRTALLIGVVVVGVNMVAAQRFAAMHRLGDYQSLERIARETAKLMLILALPLFAMCVIFPGWIMSFYGEEYSGGASVLPILAIGQLVNAATGSVTYLLMMSGNERDLRNIGIVTTCVGFAIVVAIVPVKGIMGAAITTCVMLSLQNLLAVFYVHKRLGIKTVCVPWTARPRQASVEKTEHV